MKKIILYSLITFLGITQIMAQSSQRAKNYLSEVSKKTSNYKNISLDFTYQSNSSGSNGSDYHTTGHLDLQGDLYVLEFMDVTKLFDGKKVYTISKEDQEITISNYSKDNTDNLVPSDLLKFFETGYNFKWDISANIDGKKIQYITLTPVDQKSNIKSIILGIDDTSKTVYSQVTTYKNGTKSSLVVNSLQTNQPMSKNHFTFTQSAYPDYYINKID
ncbi:LolA family protein [Myroides sp. LJL110]